MSQSGELLKALKKCLRAKGLTYKDVAAFLNISEASVKRVFAEQTFSLTRLEDVCRMLDMSIYDLARLTRLSADHDDTLLSLEQEQGLAEDSTLLVYYYLLLTGRKPQKIADEFGIAKKDNDRILIRLSRLKLVELFTRDKARLLTGRRIQWRPNGPIRRLYERQVKETFVNANFTGRDQTLHFDTGELSDSSINVLIRKIERLAQEFDELVDLELSLPNAKKRGFGLLLAFRPWTYWAILEPHTDALGPLAQKSRRK